MLLDRLTTPRPLAGLPGPVWLALCAAALAFAGGVWDVSWHRTVGRDTFWSPPHLLLYAGVGLGLLAGLWGVRTGQASAGPVWRLGRYWLPAGYALAVAGNAGVMLTA